MSTQALVPLNQKNIQVFLRAEPTKMSMSIPGLSAVIEAETGAAPEEKALYVFVSKDFKRVKRLYWDKTGFAMWYKHVPAGKAFRVEFSDGYHRITGVDVRELCKGVGKKVLTPG